jgi:predicted RNase H-like HicB family nuclease
MPPVIATMRRMAKSSVSLFMGQKRFLKEHVSVFLKIWELESELFIKEDFMEKIKVILEAGKDGYGVSFEIIPNVYGFGETVETAKADAKAALEGFVVALRKYNKPIPKVLEGGYELDFEFDIEALLKHIEGIVTKSALAKASGINPSQLSHYSSGLKKPRKEQKEKIIQGLHKLAQDLLSVAP